MDNYIQKIEFGDIAELRKEKFNPKNSKSRKCVELEHINQVDGSINGFTNSEKQKSIKNIFYKGDVLFGKLRPYLKKYWLAEFDGVCSTEIWVLKPKKDICYNSNYLYNIVQSHEFIQATNVSSGSKMPRADWKYIVNFPLSIVNSFPEQKAIAQILTIWDKAISNQQLLIDKYKLKKKGLMQKLLAPKEDWEEVRLHQIVIEKGIVRGPFGGALKKEIFVNSGYKVYEQKNAIYKSTELGKYYVNEDKYGEMQRFSVNENDLIISCSGTIGRIYKIPKIHPKGIINQALLKLTLNTKLINIDFFLFQFKSAKIQFNIIESTQGGAMKNLVGMSEFKNTKFILPSIEEQTKIANILSSVDYEIEILEKQLEKLKEQKKGLMQVLLSGQKRVNLKN